MVWFSLILLVAMAAYAIALARSLPIPFFGQTTLWGRKSVFRVSADEAETYAREANRATIRFVVGLFTLMILGLLVIVVAELL